MLNAYGNNSDVIVISNHINAGGGMDVGVVKLNTSQSNYKI